jgi:RHS repeat-associated protein
MPHNYTYDAFGGSEGRSGSTENNYLFAGEQFDRQLDSYYLRQRFYSPEIGLFSRRDDYEGGLHKPLTLHKYVYTHNNPINLIDPSGRAAFLTWTQLNELGDEIHDKIGEDFVSQDRANRRADFRRVGEGLTVLRILREADGLPNGCPPFNGRKPDLADYVSREVYEIKSKSRYAEGVLQLLINLAALNLAPGQTHTWEDGESYAYTRGPIPLKYGKIATVNSPSNGVITYNLLDDHTDSQGTSTSTTIAAITLLTILIIAAAARGTSSPGTA